MIVREIKLKLTKKQENQFREYIHILTGVYNWTIRTIKIKAGYNEYPNHFDLCNNTSGHAKRIGVNAQVFQATIKQAYNAWDRCFKKISKEPRLHSKFYKLRSFVFPQFDRKRLLQKTIKLPSLGEIRYIKQDIPEGTIKTVRIIKRASGWYAQITLDTNSTFSVKQTENSIGIDTGFNMLATLSDGTEVENQRNYVKSQKRLAQAQRGKNKKLVAKLCEKIANKRKDHNHKVSRTFVENYKYIAITNDNLKRQSKIFGKSVGDAGIAQLRNFILYKSINNNRVCILVDSKNTTKTCGNCGALTGPTGLHGLKVREWVCSSCGERHLRDINSAKVILKLGFGINLE